jgi:hypothetical protein
VLVETPWSGDFRAAFGFVVRQSWMFKKHSPQTFWLGFGAALLPPFGLAAVLANAAVGLWWWLLAPVAVAGLAEWRWRMRREMVARVIGPERLGELSRWLTADRFLRPLWQAPIPLAMAVAALRRSITWAGVTYTWSRSEGTQILQRRPAV